MFLNFPYIFNCVLTLFFKQNLNNNSFSFQVSFKTHHWKDRWKKCCTGVSEEVKPARTATVNHL